MEELKCVALKCGGLYVVMNIGMTVMPMFSADNLDSQDMV